MSDPFAIKLGKRFVSEKVFFLNESSQKIRPIYQLDRETQRHSYRVYLTSSNKKADDLDVQCADELAMYAKKGLPIRCLMPDGTANNVSLRTSGIRELIVEL